ncbi:MAG: beta/gamma crystallin-related protein [Steroidobacteraceae bacterium]
MKTILGVGAAVLSVQAMAQVTFYEGEDFHGRAYSTSRDQSDLRRGGFNDSASSVIVDKGRWEVCEDPRYSGQCVVLRPGSYDSLKRLGVNNRLSSVRKVGGRRDYADSRAPEPLPAPGYEYRQRPNERVYQARVTSVRAVLGQQPEQRCWVEREQVGDKGKRNVAGGILGGVIGGVLGHQIGGGTGKDLATAGGAVAGAVVGSNVGRDKETYSRDVRRCDTTSQNQPPDYWDVTYDYRNVTHRVQMSAPPGDTIFVNRQGEPRQ